jgi:hypothetical protein
VLIRVYWSSVVPILTVYVMHTRTRFLYCSHIIIYSRCNRAWPFRITLSNVAGSEGLASGVYRQRQ